MAPEMRHGLIAASLLLAANAQAAYVYEFVEIETGDTLAYWELSSLPAGYEEVLSLTFTPAGEAIFGLGEVYTGEFDHFANNTASDDGMGGLGDDEDNLFGAWIFDQDDVPASSLIPNPLGQRLNLFYMNDPGQDGIQYRVASPDVDITVQGDWRWLTIPEPCAIATLLPGLIAACCHRMVVGIAANRSHE